MTRHAAAAVRTADRRSGRALIPSMILILAASATQHHDALTPPGRPGPGGLSGAARRGRPRWRAVVSGEVLESGPGRGPGRLQPGHQVDRDALLVVADPEPVVEGGDFPDVGELAPEEGGIH